MPLTMTCDRIRELASGFVLGSLEPDEMIAVEDHLAACLEPHPEIEELGGVLPYLAISLPPVEPPTWLRDSVISAASADVVNRATSNGARSRPMPIAVEPRRGTPSSLQASQPGPVPALGQAARRQPVISLAAVRASRRRLTTWGLRAAAVVALVGFGALGASNGVIGPKTTPAPFYNIPPGSGSAILNPPDLHSQAAGLAVLMPSGHIIVYVNHLEPTKGNAAYVVWLSEGSGTPSKVGVVQVDSSGTGQLDVQNVPTSPRIWVYICREPSADVMVSTGPIVLSGTISF